MFEFYSHLNPTVSFSPLNFSSREQISPLNWPQAVQIKVADPPHIYYRSLLCSFISSWSGSYIPWTSWRAQRFWKVCPLDTSQWLFLKKIRRQRDFSWESSVIWIVHDNALPAYSIYSLFLYLFRFFAQQSEMATWEEYLHNQENVDGIRMTWNVLPHSRTDAQKLVVPPAVFFAPLKVRILKFFIIIIAPLFTL